MLKSAIETNFDIKDFRDHDTIAGYYFSPMTRRDAEPDDFKKFFGGQVFRERSILNFYYYFNDEGKLNYPEIFNVINHIDIKYKLSAYSLEQFLVKENELPEGTKLGGELVTKSFQTSIFYRNPESYRNIISEPLEKNYQTFDNGEEKGSIIFMRFDSLEFMQIGRLQHQLNDIAFPDAEHPEELFYKDNLMIIYCFDWKSRLKDELKKQIEKKL